MNLLQRLAKSDSPKLNRPLRAAAGYALQLSGFSRHLTIARHGYRLPFNPSSNIALTLWTDPLWNEPAERFAAAWLRPGETVLDVGANIGVFTAAASTRVGPSGHVHAIEAHPGTFGMLMDTVKLNRFSNVTCHHVAASDHAGHVRISDLGRKDDNNHLVTDGNQGIAVRSTTLSDLLEAETIARVALLKIDVEGHELAVLRGLGNKVKVDCIHVEALETVLARNGQTVDSLRDWLTKAGYHLYRHEGDPTNLVAIQDPEAALLRCELEPLPAKSA